MGNSPAIRSSALDAALHAVMWGRALAQLALHSGRSTTLLRLLWTVGPGA